MTQRHAGVPPSKDRPRKRSGPSWPFLLGGGLGLFLVSFYVGLNGLPHHAPVSLPAPAPPPSVESAPAVNDRRQVSVRELPAETVTQERAPERRKSSRRPRSAESAASAPISPSAPAGRARVQEDSSPPDTPVEDAAAQKHEEPSTAEAVPSSTGSFKVQAGAYGDEENARKMADRLAASGYQPSMTTSKSAEGTMYHVQVGPFPEKKAAEDAVRDLGQQGVPARVADE